ncbi:4Fe-4S dicluster domain-containing protein [Vibrio xiamenensis]|uniref:4Fe-4S dicluster domain-containing protein n=1 Tax=Vibrio xiamenensis TaxID=861298 RepID=A0A1G7YBW0_9VIBR|nr:4Fe-4S binding protein [Vibrio xiamenensis]SDG93961.1 4Fe-4S dicluster domain-containing protein [Vibrio xiamenensis]
MLKEFLQQSTSINGRARNRAVTQTVELGNLIPPTVSYESSGRTLLIGPSDIVQRVYHQLSGVMSSVTLLSTDGEPSDVEGMYYTDSVEISGFLGQFNVWVEHQAQSHNLAQIAIQASHFDIVVDLCLTSCMDQQVAVPGYYPVGRGTPKLAEALEEIPTLVGTFDKPKYFRLDTDLCAHSSRGVTGCERCVDACPAGALSSQGSPQTGFKIDINPYLCQGIGTCATSCPTEAIHYALPDPHSTQKFIERTLSNYLNAQGKSPVVFFCSQQDEEQTVKALSKLDDNFIPIELEEVSSVGIDTWFAALANGAHQVLISVDSNMPSTALKVLNQELCMAHALLEQLNINSRRISLVYRDSDFSVTGFDEPLCVPIGELEGNKRERLFQALEAISERHIPLNKQFLLHENAPFGNIECASDDCTSCMSCVAVCPTGAIHSDGQSPKIEFIEQDCVQCGLCVKACPEQVLSRQPRFNWDHQQRRSTVILHQEPAAHCLRCHKPFAPQSMITKLQDKLRGHSHFSNSAALDRIAMCEDCRVIDMFESLAHDPLKQLNI